MAKYIEVIEWFDPTGKEMVHRFEAGGEIKIGAQLVVQESHGRSSSGTARRSTYSAGKAHPHDPEHTAP